MSTPKTTPRPSQKARMDVLMEAGFRCGNPRCNHVLTLDIHHIEWVKEGGGNDPSNLLALCPNCHTLHTAGHIPGSAIRHWKGMLVALNNAFDRRSTDLLVYLHQLRAHVWYPAHVALDFASLIARGLVKCQYHTHTGASTPPSSIVWVTLSDAGRMLVDAWYASDEGKLLEIVSSPSPQGE